MVVNGLEEAGAINIKYGKHNRDGLVCKSLTETLHHRNYLP